MSTSLNLENQLEKEIADFQASIFSMIGTNFSESVDRTKRENKLENSAPAMQSMVIMLKSLVGIFLDTLLSTQSVGTRAAEMNAILEDVKAAIQNDHDRKDQN